MSYILMVFTVVAASGNCNYDNCGSRARDWRPLGEFRTEASCEKAKQTLGGSNLMRCVEK